MERGTIEVNVKTGYNEDFDKLVPLQGELKAFDDPLGFDDLKNSIIDEGIIFPTFVWLDGETKYVWDGHGRQQVYRELQLDGFEVPPLPVVYINAKDRTDAKRKLLKKEEDYRRRISADGLADFLSDVDLDFGDISEIKFPGLDPDFVNNIMQSMESAGENNMADPNGQYEEPENETVVPSNPETKPGDVWSLGQSRIMCGDSTEVHSIEKLMDGDVADLIHADPPYGMGKEADGVVNDNIYNDKLDEFQMMWWASFRGFVSARASAYIWGNSYDLWRLWFNRLEATEKFEFKNQIVWDKKNIAGMKSALLLEYPTASEHCLFFAFGDQLKGNINTEDYYEGWEEVRLYLASEAEKFKITASLIHELCGCHMFSHWFRKTQFSLIPEKHYATLAQNYPEGFQRSWKELKRLIDRANTRFAKVKKQKRAYFDNAHDVMHDVWEFPRVVGAERWGHATPKPVEMIARIMMSSLEPGGLCVEPFAGAGSTLIAAEQTGRKCYAMELQACYCDVIVMRYVQFCKKNGKAIEVKLNGEPYNGDLIRG